jgi:formate hydrogenlyase subunit 3/multisubunit Na+/H+ antiporter MnhD subunit
MDLPAFVQSNWGPVFSLVAAVLLLLVGIYSYASGLRSASRWLAGALLGGLVIAALWVQPLLPRILLLDAAALAAVALVWLQNRKAGWLFLAAALGGSILVAGGLYAAGLFAGAALPAGGLDKLAIALLAVGFALKLALVPLYVWLPSLAESSSPMTAVLVIGLLDMAELGELAALRGEAPWIFSGGAQSVWLGLALLSMFGGALLALSQRSLRRMLAFSAIDDTGYLLLGILAGTSLGVGGALLGALSHAVCKFLLFAAVGNAEAGLGKKLTLDMRGLAGRFPVSAAAFIVGALGMVGVPPFLGWVGRWRLYLAGIDLGGWQLGLAMALASALAILYYVRAIHRVWLGTPESDQVAPEPRLLRGTLVIVIIMLVLAGLYLGFGPGMAIG